LQWQGRGKKIVSRVVIAIPTENLLVFSLAKQHHFQQILEPILWNDDLDYYVNYFCSYVSMTDHFNFVSNFAVPNPQIRRG
jgi:hypothetical protein